MNCKCPNLSIAVRLATLITMVCGFPFSACCQAQTNPPPGIDKSWWDADESNTGKAYVFDCLRRKYISKLPAARFGERITVRLIGINTFRNDYDVKGFDIDEHTTTMPSPFAALASTYAPSTNPHAQAAGERKPVNVDKLGDLKGEYQLMLDAISVYTMAAKEAQKAADRSLVYESLKHAVAAQPTNPTTRFACYDVMRQKGRTECQTGLPQAKSCWERFNRL